MSVIVHSNEGTKETIAEGTEVQANDDGTLVVFGPQKSGSASKNRIAVYAAGHWSKAQVDSGPSDYDKALSYLGDAWKEYSAPTTKDPIPVEDFRAEMATALNDLIAEIQRHVKPPKEKITPKNPIDPEALRRLAAEEAGTKATEIRPR